MSEWWDENKGKYRRSLPYKVFYVWLWPVENWFMTHCLTREQAHWFALHVAIPTVGRIEDIWRFLVTFCVVFLLVLIRLICFIPGFTCTPPQDENEE